MALVKAINWDAFCFCNICLGIVCRHFNLVSSRNEM
jgi:hypothetical protein